MNVFSAVQPGRRLARALPIWVALVLFLAAANAPDVALAGEPDTVGQVDPSTGIWRLRTPSGSVASFYFGDPGDLPFVGDWDCDGIDTPGLYRQSDGYVYLRNSNTQGIANVSFFFGNPGDVAIAGDFNGDGCDTVSIYRPSTATVYIMNRLGSSDSGLGSADYFYVFGNPGDTPFVGDFSADGIDSIGLHRVSTGYTYLKFLNTQGAADVAFFFGDPGDHFVSGDWDADSRDTPGVFRPSSARFYLKNSNTQGNADVEFSFGSPGILPVAGAWGALDADLELALEVVASGFNQPVFVTSPEGSKRLFVVEKNGTIRIVDNGTTLPTPFLTVQGVSTNGERGLLGLAFHPDYASNGRFYVHYTNTSGDTRVVEYFAAPGSDIASLEPVATLLSVVQPASNHNGGMIAFDRAGYLLVALGDGGGEPGAAPQDIDNLLGSILRLDVDASAPNNGAPDNPFVGVVGDDRIWAYGLRNPWRFSIDRVSGDLYIGDVGEGTREEINYARESEAGINYGWALTEGSLCFPIGSSCSTAGLRLPAIEYQQSGGRAVTGGYVYRGTAIPGLYGTYFYGDFVQGFIRSARFVGGTATDLRDRALEFGVVPNIASFGQDGLGELYVVSVNGIIYKIIQKP